MVLGVSSAWADQVTVSMTTFSAISGNVDDDENISYAAAKGSAGTAPAVNNSQIRVYQNGGTFTVSANNGAKINSITLGSAMNTSVSYKVDNGTESANQSITENGTITVNNIDCTTVLFTCKGTDKNSRLYVNSLSVTYTPAATIHVTKVELDKTTAIVSIGGTETLTATITPDDATNKNLTWSSSNEAVATVANGVVKGVSVGDATITVTTVDGSKTATCTVTVTKPEFIFYESFDGCNGYGGNDKSWNGSIASADFNADNTWTVANAYGANKCAKFGTSSKKGTATTPAFGEAGNLLVTFKAAAWKGNNEQTELVLKVSDGATLSASSVTMEKGAWKEYEIVIFNATTSTQLTFEGNNANNSRFFLDEVKVKKAVEKVTVTEAGYATYYAPYALDFSGVKGLTAYKAIEKDDYVDFEPVTEVPAGAGVLLKAKQGEQSEYEVPVIATASALTDNVFVGVANADETINGNNGKFYVLRDAPQGLGFYKINASTYHLKQGTAYLSLNNALAKNFIDIDNTTSIGLIGASKNDAQMFNLAGQRVGNDYKGIVIVNGKKVIR